MTATPAIAICGVDFGWGSAGKLSAIVQACLQYRSQLRFVVLGTQLGRRVLAGTAVDAWYGHWPSDPVALRALFDRHGVSAGLVVLDPHAAQAFESAGCPTAFVDSLPYLWTAADTLPFDVAAYCAQQCPHLPEASWRPLSRISRLHWVGGIVSRMPSTTRDPGLAVLNLGGLHSPANPDGNPIYLRLVLGPALAALARAGYRTVHICGNLNTADVPVSAEHASLAIHIGPRPHAEFLALLSQAGLLMTSPGLTTLLESSAAQTPTVCLPPQNLSQIFNGDRFAALVSAGCHVRWPRTVLDLTAVERARMGGEEAGLEVIDHALNVADPISVQPWLRGRLTAAIRQAERHQTWSALADDAGYDGARQVAEIVLGLVDARQDVRAPSTAATERGHAQA